MIYQNFDSMPLVIDVVDIADTLKIGRNKAYELINSGQIQSVKIGNHYRVLRDSFVSFLKGQA
ncbi:MAG: helix-turn-helix domain-containing protein [Clostridia bacterium]|nr:helix-turn-helix domain-containing protein [Clostridia bacterium]